MAKEGKVPPPPPPEGRNPKMPGRADGGWPRMALFVAMGILIVLAILTGTSGDQNPAEEITLSEMWTFVENGEVESIKYENGSAQIEGVFKADPNAPTPGEDEVVLESRFATTGLADFSDDEKRLLRDSGVSFEAVTPTQSALWNLVPFLPFIFILGFFYWMAKRQQSQMGGIMSIGRSKAKTYSSERPGTSFDDVAGYKGVKREITEVVNFLKEPARFAEIGARIPKGVLLVGPPGTGKTLIARAVAGEAGVPFLSVTGSDFMEMLVGVGASRVRDLSNEARKMGRAIIFIDEIDSIGRKRGAGMGGGHDEREQTLNQMLAEMDGFEPHEGIVMMAATNRPDILDPALLRPGRFDRQVVVPLPELDDRREILGVHMKHKKMGPDVDVDVIARGTPGMSGADLANLVNEAALFAVRQGETRVAATHFDQARDRVLLGIERENMVRTQGELERTAYHEAGHALAAAVLPTHDPVHKVTIIPTGMALGVTMTLPEGDRYSLEQAEAEDRITMALGGRMAEKLVFGEVSSVAADDLRQATSMARRMVTVWGMSDVIGPMSLSDNGPVFVGDFSNTQEYSAETSKLIDEEVRRILLDMQTRCADLLVEKRTALDFIARQLLERETVSGEEILRLIAKADEPPISQSEVAPAYPAPGHRE